MQITFLWTKVICETPYNPEVVLYASYHNLANDKGYSFSEPICTLEGDTTILYLTIVGDSLRVWRKLLPPRHFSEANAGAEVTSSPVTLGVAEDGALVACEVSVKGGKTRRARLYDLREGKATGNVWADVGVSGAR